MPEDRLPITDRGLAYGDGVFETIRLTEKGPVLLDQHLSRLRAGLSVLGIQVGWDLLYQQIQSYPAFNALPNISIRAKGIVKIIITRGVGGRGYGAQNVNGPSCIISFYGMPQYPDDYYSKGVSIFSCKTRLASDAQLAGIKHLNRLPQVLARQEWGSGAYQEGLMRDYQGNVIEGVFSNIFLVKGNRVTTPDLTECGVRGVMRDWLLQQLREQEITVEETPVTLDDFTLADECFFCNSVFGIWPVTRFQEHVWAVGQVTRQLQQSVQSCWGL